MHTEKQSCLPCIHVELHEDQLLVLKYFSLGYSYRKTYLFALYSRRTLRSSIV